MPVSVTDQFVRIAFFFLYSSVGEEAEQERIVNAGRECGRMLGRSGRGTRLGEKAGEKERVQERKESSAHRLGRREGED